MTALDISPTDHFKLADIFDPNHDGSISIVELVHGLEQMRGPMRRSDIVRVLVRVGRRHPQPKLET